MLAGEMLITPTPEQLDKIHIVGQELLDAFDRICKENGLRYYLGYGTLLGAIRHQGPIPWDDDVDVCMPRKDLERFKQIMLALPDDETFHIHCFENDPKYPYLFPRLNKRGTVCRLMDVRTFNMRYKEIWLDVFPLDDIKSTTGWRHWLRCTHISALMRLEVSRQSGFKNRTAKGFIARLALSPIPVSWLRERFYKAVQKPSEHGDHYIHWDKHYGFEKEMMPKEWFDPPTKALYNGKLYSVPGRPAKVLEHIYGDYMKLQPEDKRVQHTYLEIKL